MSEQKFSHTPKTRYESLYDLKSLSLWSPNKSEWSSITNEEIQATTSPWREEASNLTNKVALLGSLVILALLGAAAWIQAPAIVQGLQEVGKNSAHQLTSEINNPL